jgi:hypothetical protein
LVFHFLILFWISFAPISNLGQTRYLPCVLGWWGPQVWDWFWGSTPSGHI